MPFPQQLELWGLCPDSLWGGLQLSGGFRRVPECSGAVDTSWAFGGSWCGVGGSWRGFTTAISTWSVATPRAPDAPNARGLQRPPPPRPRAVAPLHRKKTCSSWELTHQEVGAFAEAFSKYIAYRTDWLEAWEQNKYVNPTKEEANELWQMRLWVEGSKRKRIPFWRWD